MNFLDLIVVVAAASAVVGGWRLGFLARAVSWVGMAVGLYVAARLLPAAIRTFDGSTPTTRLIVAAVVLIGGAFVGQALGLLAGARIRRFVAIGPLRTVDRAVGGAVGLVGVIVALWLLLPAMSNVPGSVARQARGSAVARFVDSELPPPPNTLQTLRRLVGNSAFPQVFDALRPAPDTGPPPASTGMAPAILSRVEASTVKVSGLACDRIQEGSGFTVAPDTILTNAHVVAGERSTSVLMPTGSQKPATVVLFDADRDIAILHVGGLPEAPLPIGTASTGTTGAVFGHPNGVNNIVIAPAAIRREVVAVGRDLYDQHQTSRAVFILASALHPGDSGGALVNQSGVVVGMAFAIAPDRPGTSYALTAKELNADLAAPRTGAPVSTRGCTGA